MNNKYQGRFLKGILVLLFWGLTSFRTNDAKSINIIFIGDSITYGEARAELEPSVYAVAYLKKKMGIDSIHQINDGISGKTTADFQPSTDYYKTITKQADSFYSMDNATLVFSFMLGTNDSAIQGTNGAPVSPPDYRKNMETIIDQLLNRYPKSKVIVNCPLWYSPNTYNSSKYLAEGLARLQDYFPQVRLMVKNYSKSHPGNVFIGDQSGFNYFRKNYLEFLRPEQGKMGIFYLHPDIKGAAKLGEFWGKALYKTLKR